MYMRIIRLIKVCRNSADQTTVTTTRQGYVNP